MMLCTLVLASFSTISLQAQAPKFVNEFLNIGVGADAHGMFGSVTATVDDVTAGYWNPAGLTQIENPLQVSAMHSSWFGGIANYDYFGAAKVLNESKKTVGALTVIRMGIDGIPNTLSLVGPDGSINYANVTEFSTADYTTTVNAWSFDLSPENEAILLATGNDVPISSTEIALPKLILAAAKKGNAGNLSYLVEADLRFSTDGTKSGIASADRFALDPTFGVELGYNELAYLRFGVGNMQNILNEVNSDQSTFSLQPNVGLGINLGRLHIDYALGNIGTVSEALISHIFSVKLDFQSKY